MAILLSPPDGACWRFNRLFCWEGWPKVVFGWKIEVAPCFVSLFLSMRDLDSPGSNAWWYVWGETFISTRHGRVKFCLKKKRCVCGVVRGQLNVAAGTGHPEQLVTGGHRSSKCIESLHSGFGFAFFLLILDLDFFSTVHLLCCTGPLLRLPYTII